MPAKFYPGPLRLAGVICENPILSKYISYYAVMHDSVQQEGQHPLTGQRAANFRLSFL